jgi:hypothetical protein
MTYVPADDRYEHMTYRRSGRSGLLLPAISLGLWQNFGYERALEQSRAIVRRAFDLGRSNRNRAREPAPSSTRDELGAFTGQCPRTRATCPARLRARAQPARRARFRSSMESHQARIQVLQLCLRERVEMHTRSRLGRAHRLPPAQQNLRVACRGDRALAQATFDLCVTRRLAVTARSTFRRRPRCAPEPQARGGASLRHPRSMHD